MKHWETIADHLHDVGWSLDWVSALDVEGANDLDSRRAWLWKAFIVGADELLTAFVELQRAIHEFAVSLIHNGPSRNVRAR